MSGGSEPHSWLRFCHIRLYSPEQQIGVPRFEDIRHAVFDGSGGGCQDDVGPVPMLHVSSFNNGRKTQTTRVLQIRGGGEMGRFPDDFKDFKLEQVRQALFRSWSIETSSKWTLDNPARGQCSVTALVINDLFGGEILKTLLPEGWHFYNRIDGQRYDFTDSQFDGPIDYMDLPSNRDEAMLDTSPQQYSVLKQNLLRHLGEKESSHGK